MKKLFISLLLALGVTAWAQTTNTNSTPIISGPIDQAITFLGTGSNWMVAPYGIYNPQTGEAGAGVGAGYKLSDFVVPTMRIDVLDVRKPEEIWMPSVNLQLQVPMLLFGKLYVVPFVSSGIATPISGKGDDNGTAVGIFGGGLAVRLASHWALIGDYEKWTGFEGEQIRFGFLYKF